MATISLNNGATRIDCSDLTDAQAQLVEEHIANWSMNVELVDEIREFAADRCEQNAKSFVLIFADEYTRRTGEVVTLP